MKKAISLLVAVIFVIGWLVWWKTNQASEPFQATVVSVVDGDTVDVLLVDGRSERVRILGIDTPEHGECGNSEATQALTALLSDQEVQLVDDPFSDDKDRFGRILAYVEVEGTDAGLSQIEAGMAAAWWPSSANPPVRGVSYLAAERSARHGLIGSWGSCGTIGR